MVYDSVRSVVLLAGGSTTPDGGKTYTTFDDVWSYDGQQWRALGSSGALRSGMALAFDSKRGRVLGYGGYCPCKTSDSGTYSDLQELRGGTWVKIADIPSRPSTDSRMVYDARRDRLVLFGGSRGRQRLTDVWEFDGAEWHKRDIATPAELRDVAMAYDEARGRTVVVGSSGTSPDSTRTETWEYDGVSWTRVSADGPPPVVSPNVVYDSKRRVMILQGRGHETWSWDGTTWRKISERGPSPRYLSAMVYDSKRDRVVLFGGRPGLPKADANDTWEWDGTAWKELPMADQVVR